jgi:hypothetical protein
MRSNDKDHAVLTASIRNIAKEFDSGTIQEKAVLL